MRELVGHSLTGTYLYLLCVKPDISTTSASSVELASGLYLKNKIFVRRLIVKLKAYGISDRMCNWVENFLYGRKRVQVNGQFF